MLKISKANNKLKGLIKCRDLKKYLTNKKIYSLDLLSGYSCPSAHKCLSKVVIKNGKKRIKDGPHNEFRCFSASQEVLFPRTYSMRKANLDYMLSIKQNVNLMKNEILKVLPTNAGIIRIHSAGDFFNQKYFKAWLKVAELNPHILFYAYTKCLKYWINNRQLVDKLDNFILTASYGGRDDHLISKHGLRYVRVVYTVGEARLLGLSIDKNDICAANPHNKYKSFALLIHGIQPAHSEAGKAVHKLKGLGSYGRK